MNEQLLKLLQLAARLPDGASLSFEGSTKGALKFYLWANSDIVHYGNSESGITEFAKAIDTLEAFCDGKLQVVEVPARTSYKLEPVAG